MVPAPKKEKIAESESRARKWNLRILFIFIVLIFLLLVSGKHFTMLDSIITQHEPFRSDFNGPLTQPGLVHISDNVTQIIPGKIFTQEQIRDGRIPLWNPRIFCGMPHMADLHSQVFSITDTPFLIFMPVDDALGAAALLKLVLAAYFMYLFCRHLWIDRRLALAAGILYAFSSFTLAWLHFPSFLSTTLYYPLGLMLWDRYLTQVEVRLRRRSQLLLGLVMGLMILGGQLQLFANFVILAGLYAAFSGRGTYVGSRLSRLKGLVMPFILGLMIGMVQLLPAIELMLQSTRTPGGFNLITDIQAVASAPALAFSVMGNILMKILTIAFPFGWGRLFPTDAQPFPEAVIYVGATALLCLLASPRIHRGPFDRFLYRLCIAAILVNLFSLILNSVFSFFGLLEFLNPGRCAMAITVLALPLLAVWRIDSFRKGDRRLDQVINPKTAIIAASVFFLVLLGAFIVMVAPVLTGKSPALNSITVVLFYFGELIVLIMLFRYLRNAGTMSKRGTTIEIIAAAMIAEGLLLAAVIAVPGAKLTTEDVKYNSLTQIFANEEEPFRIARYVPLDEKDFKTPNRLVKRRSPMVKPNEGMIIGIDDFQGYNSLNPKIFSEYVKSIDERLFMNLRGSIDLYSFDQLDAPQLDEANVVFILSEIPLEHSSLRKVLDHPVKVYRRESAYPRAFLSFADDSIAPVDIREYNPGFLRASYDSQSEGVFVLTENALRGWEARVDGEWAEIHKHQGTPFISINAPPGEHEVVLTYKPFTFYFGLFISLLGLVLVVVFLWLLLSKRVSSAPMKGSSRYGGTS